MHKQNNYFPVIHVNFVCIFIDCFVEIVDFLKISVQFAKETRDFIGFTKFTGS